MKALRQARDLTQEDLGKSCRPPLSRQAINKIENGGDTALTTIESISSALGTTSSVLLEHTPMSSEAIRLAAQIRALPEEEQDVFYRALANMKRE